MILKRKTLKSLYLFVCVSVFISTNSFAEITPDDSIVINYDALLSKFPDLFYEYKIAELNAQTPLELEFNDYVKEYILLYLTKRREQLSDIIGLADLYFPIFEEYLDKYGLPLELKYLPVVESALDPRARSSSGAMGLWQFKLNTSKMFDLHVSSYVDERCDPYKSTDAACRYLKYLFNIFNDWSLTLAAYNSGPGEIRNAIERSKGQQNFWQIYNELPEQTRNYIPAFIAMNYLMNHYHQHEINPIIPDYSFFDVDTVHVTHPISFKSISDNIDLPLEIIRVLNPVYKLDYIPANGHAMILILPADYLYEFVKAENVIYANSNSVFNYHENFDFEKALVKDKEVMHVVKKGEFLHKIALKYHCTIEEIMTWNELTDQVIHEGQKLKIWTNSGN